MYLLFDIGGSKTRLALTADLQELSEPYIIDTPDKPQTLLPEIKKYLDSEATAGSDLRGAYGGVTGVWDTSRSRLVYSPNMTGWVGEPIKELLETELRVPVRGENDADIVGLGEVHFGAGRDSQICAYLTISTGVGGGRIVAGRIDRATVGFEPGHQIIDYSKVEGEDQYDARLEGRVSGTALAQRYHLPAYEIEDDTVWEEVAEETAVGVCNTILHWSPDTVVLGGSMIVGDPAISVERVAHHVRNLASFLPELPVIKKAELGAVGGLYGALAYAKQLE